MICRYCGSEDVEYLGIDDGGGLYGDAVCEQWRCEDCGQYFEIGCIGDVSESWEQQAVNEIIADEEPDIDDDDTRDFTF